MRDRLREVERGESRRRRSLRGRRVSGDLVGGGKGRLQGAVELGVGGHGWGG